MLLLLLLLLLSSTMRERRRTNLQLDRCFSSSYSRSGTIIVRTESVPIGTEREKDLTGKRAEGGREEEKHRSLGHSQREK